MPEPLEVLRARVLLSFVNEDSRRCTVTGLSAALGVALTLTTLYTPSYAVTVDGASPAPADGGGTGPGGRF